MLEVLVGAVLVLIVILVTKDLLERFDPRRPPGPWGLPLFGYVPFLSSCPHEDYHRLAKKYGPVFGLYAGSRYTVILGDYASIKEAYNKEEFLDRPESFSLFQDEPNVLSMNGWQWKETRRFVLSTLRTLGMGKNKLEERILEEIAVDLDELEKLGPEAEVNTQDFFFRAFANNIFSIVNGLKFENSSHILSLMKLFKSFVFLEGVWVFFTYNFPVMFFVYKLLRFFGIRKNYTKEVDKYLNQEIRLHEKHFDADHKEDFFDYYLEEMKKKQGKESPFNASTMIGNAKTLLVAGTETTQVTLDWVLLCLAKYPEIQEKIHLEITDLLGREKPPSWNDRDALPYTYAFLMEVQRAYTIGPASDPHFSARSGTVAGYRVPEGSVLLANVYAVHNDQKLWGDPDNFRPERFISPQGKLITPEYWMPFLIGKRMCPGEKLASMQLFLFAVSIVQKFKVLPPKSGLSLEGSYGMMYYAVKPKVRFQRRA